MQNKLNSAQLLEESDRSPDIQELKLRYTYSESDANTNTSVSTKFGRCESADSQIKPEDPEEIIQKLMNIIKEKENEITKLKSTVNTMEGLQKRE
jgi:hypothetical protein